MVTPPAALDVIVRFHDRARLDELGRAIFSLALSDHRPLSIQLACQRMDAAAQASIHAALAPILSIVPDVGLTLLNDWKPDPRDARAALLNLGLGAGQGRYAAFLDYDDLIYPEGHRLLIAELEASGAAIAFAGILNVSIDRDGAVPFTAAKQRVFAGSGLGQLLHNNFCPLHSFVLDRSRIARQDLRIDETFAALEDYEFLLRLCARYPSSFRLKDKIIGEYLLKNDGSNINPLANSSGPSAQWQAAIATLNDRKTRLTLSLPVQSLLGVDEPGLTVADYLARQTGT